LFPLKTAKQHSERKQKGLQMRNPVLTGGLFVHFCKKLSGIVTSFLIAVLFFVSVRLNAQESLTLREMKYDKIVLTAAARHGVDPLLVKAIIFTESTFYPGKVGKDGEIGLMQIRTVAAIDWAKAKGIPTPSKEQMYNPELNIEIGTWYITRALRRWYKNPDFLRMALAEYNAGRARLLEWMADYNHNTDLVLANKPVGKYADKVCKKYVEYVILNEKPEAKKTVKTAAK